MKGALSLRKRIKQLEEVAARYYSTQQAQVRFVEDMATWSLYRFWRWKRDVRRLENQRLDAMESQQRAQNV